VVRLLAHEKAVLVQGGGVAGEVQTEEVVVVPQPLGDHAARLGVELVVA